MCSSDLRNPRAIPPSAVAIWSLATALGGFARGFLSLFIARSAVGVGEAAYGTIAPAVLADSFPLERRGRVMAVFFMAIPVGSAAGYVLGGLVDRHAHAGRFGVGDPRGVGARQPDADRLRRVEMRHEKSDGEQADDERGIGEDSFHSETALIIMAAQCRLRPNGRRVSTCSAARATR